MKTTLFYAYFFLVTNLFNHKGICQEAKFPEPEFEGDVFLIKDNQTYPLEKQKNYERTSSKLSAASIAKYNLTGVQTVSTESIIAGEKSLARIAQGADLQFIIRVENNNISPLDRIDIVKFKVTYNKRKIELMEYNGLSGGSSSNASLIYRIKFNGARYGTSSYLITIPSIKQGEYGITFDGTTFNTFGVDYYFKPRDKIIWFEKNSVLRNGDRESHIGIVKEIGNNKINAEFKNDNGINYTEILNTLTDDVRLIDEASYLASLKPKFEIGDFVEWMSSGEQIWRGEIFKINGSTIEVKTSNKGEEFTKTLSINLPKKVDSKDVNISDYSPVKIFDKISVGDKVKLQNPQQRYDIWIGIYIGSTDDAIGIKTTNKGHIIIKDIKIDDYIISKL